MCSPRKWSDLQMETKFLRLRTATGRDWQAWVPEIETGVHGSGIVKIVVPPSAIGAASSVSGEVGPRAIRTLQNLSYRRWVPRLSLGICILYISLVFHADYCVRKRPVGSGFPTVLVWRELRDSPSSSAASAGSRAHSIF